MAELHSKWIQLAIITMETFLGRMMNNEMMLVDSGFPEVSGPNPNFWWETKAAGPDRHLKRIPGHVLRMEAMTKAAGFFDEFIQPKFDEFAVLTP